MSVPTECSLRRLLLFSGDGNQVFSASGSRRPGGPDSRPLSGEDRARGALHKKIGLAVAIDQHLFEPMQASRVPRRMGAMAGLHETHVRKHSSDLRVRPAQDVLGFHPGQCAKVAGPAGLPERRLGGYDVARGKDFAANSVLTHLPTKRPTWDWRFAWSFVLSRNRWRRVWRSGWRRPSPCMVYGGSPPWA